MAHLTCIGRTRDQVATVLEELEASGVKNVIALRGDAPRNDPDFDEANGEFSSPIELVEFIKRRFDMFVAAACYPEGHPDAANLQSDVEHAKRKADAGADLFISQLFFDNADFFAFLNRAQQVGIRIPIIPGLLPIIGARQVRRFTRMTGSRIPAALDRKIAEHEGDDGAVAELGVEHTTGQLSELLASSIPGVHFYALNRTHSVSKVLQNVGIAPQVIP